MFLLAWLLVILPFLGLFHTYLFYPWLMRQLALRKTESDVFFAEADPNLPQVSILCSLFNEEAVIEAKLASLAGLQYPPGKLTFYFGSDQSTDQTNAIVAAQAAAQGQFHFFPFGKRRGKPPVINELVEKAIAAHGTGPNHVLIITDANVLLSPQSVYRLVRHFKQPEIALVDAHMQHTGIQTDGISKAEDHYISREVKLKYHEGRAWGRMLGPFGGCYAIRSDYFSPVPPNFLVDDFYIAMGAFERGGLAVNDLEAYCYEAVSHSIKEEFRRKKRISAGNYQNLRRFGYLCWSKDWKLSFAFCSHKILRWLGPFLMLSIGLGAVILTLMGNIPGQVLLINLVVFGLLLPGLDVLLASQGIHWRILRSLRYFILMNIALLAGFFKYLKGIKSNVWQPTKRN
jgi:cellulose synthase/poly-beta-1,6-N-acetylglucosamine synthase-like glycosyltransferase